MSWNFNLTMHGKRDLKDNKIFRYNEQIIKYSSSLRIILFFKFFSSLFKLKL